MPWGLEKQYVCGVAGCGFPGNLRARPRQQISHFTLATLKSQSSKASFIHVFTGGEATLRKQLLRYFQNTFCQVFVFCLVKALLLFMSSLCGLSHFAISAVWRDSVSDVCVFGRGCLFPLDVSCQFCFSGTPTVENFAWPVEASWISNEDANLNSNSKLKIPLNN